METKKLTCCDLMVGDYAMAKNEPIRIATPIGNETVLHQLIIYGYTSDGAKVGPFLETELSAIPLTAEILEKFGFVKHRDIFYRLAVHIDEFNGYMFTLVADFDGVFCLQSNRFVRFSYVHELQHALRLCGIDKEIVL